MKTKYAYQILSLLFSCVVLAGNRADAEAPAVNAPAKNPPFENYITGTGIVEPTSGNIIISSSLNRRVEKIDVKVNDQVKKGDILFELYNQDLVSAFNVRQKKYDEAISNLHRLEALPKEEDLKIAQANLNRAQAIVHEASELWCQSCTCDEKQIRFFKLQQAEAELCAECARFEKVRKGAGKFDLKIAQDQAGAARADMESIRSEIERTIVRAPIDGTILTIKIREGENLDPGKSALVMGNIEALRVRVAIDQFNAAKFNPEAQAVAYKQGDMTAPFPLQFLYVEPVMVPKKYLSNDLHEKVDTQNFEILYGIDKTQAHIFIGEQLNVYIEVTKK